MKFYARTRNYPNKKGTKKFWIPCRGGITRPETAYKSFPHQLSGGMRQRAMVAQAMVCGPSLIIADEPTSSLDVTLQVKIMGLFSRLRKKNISILLISHDLEMISHLADETIVLAQPVEVFQ